MKRNLIVALAALAVLVAVTSVPASGGPGEDVEGMINRAVAVFTDHPPAAKSAGAALADILDASLLILPATPYASQYRTLVGTAKREFQETSLFTQKAHTDLAAAYRLVAAGEEWKFPEASIRPRDEGRGIDRARVYCQAEIDSALREFRAGQRESAVGHLVSFVLLVITPIER